MKKKPKPERIPYEARRNKDGQLINDPPIEVDEDAFLYAIRMSILEDEQKKKKRKNRNKN